MDYGTVYRVRHYAFAPSMLLTTGLYLCRMTETHGNCLEKATYFFTEEPLGKHRSATRRFLHVVVICGTYLMKTFHEHKQQAVNTNRK